MDAGGAFHDQSAFPHTESFQEIVIASKIIARNNLFVSLSVRRPREVVEGLAAEVAVAGVRLKPETVFLSLPSQGRGEKGVKILAKREARVGWQWSAGKSTCL